LLESSRRGVPVWEKGGSRGVGASVCTRQGDECFLGSKGEVRKVGILPISGRSWWIGGGLQCGNDGCLLEGWGGKDEWRAG
jgi:hypothetical protein